MISYYADLAIGLILAFLLLSLLVSGINEGIVRLLGIRSKFLWAYLRDTLDGAEAADGTSRLERILNALKGFGHRLRGPLMEMLPPSDGGRSRLPATVLGVFARLPFGRDPRPVFSQRPPPVESPPLAPASGTVAAERMDLAMSAPAPAPRTAPGTTPGTAPGTAAGAASDGSFNEAADDAADDGQGRVTGEVRGASPDPAHRRPVASAAEIDGAVARMAASALREAGIDLATSVDGDPADGTPGDETPGETPRDVDGAADPAHSLLMADEPEAGPAVVRVTADALREGALETPEGGIPEDRGTDPAHSVLQADAEETNLAVARLGLAALGPPAPAPDPAHTPAPASEHTPGPAPASGPAYAGTATAAGDVPDVPDTDVPDAAGSGVVPPSQGKSMAELLHERLQEIDHRKRGRTSIAEIPAARFAVAVMEIATEHGGVEALMRDLEYLRSPFYRPLKAVWDRASHDLEAFRRGVEDWFDGEMDRLTQLYRRYVRWVLAVLGLVVTLVFSMDALEYGKTLLRDNAYRSAVTAFAQSGPEALEPLREQCEPGQDTYACVTDVLSTPAFVKIFTHAPVSVTMSGTEGPAWAWRGEDWWDRLTSPGHWPGFLVTLVALLFGAPFWWDILRRVSGLRTRTFGGAST